MTTVTTKYNIQERFEAKLKRKRNSDCILWVGKRHPQTGRGYMQIANKNRIAAHIALKLVGRSVPKGKQAQHTCNNPVCVNPKHLIVGTQKQNLEYMRQCGRARNQKQTHCLRGHSLSGPDVYINPQNHRVCKICRRLHDAARSPRKVETA